MKTTHKFWVFYIILLILVFVSFTSCTFELTDSAQECKEWNEAIDDEIELIEAGYDKLTKGKVKQIGMLNDLRCEL